MLLGVHIEESFKIMLASTLNSNYLFILVDFIERLEGINECDFFGMTSLVILRLESGYTPYE